MFRFIKIIITKTLHRTNEYCISCLKNTSVLMLQSEANRAAKQLICYILIIFDMLCHLFSPNPVCLSVLQPSICLSGSPSVCFSICPSVYLSVCLPICPSVCLCLYPFALPSVCPSIRPSICLSIVHPSGLCNKMVPKS